MHQFGNAVEVIGRQWFALQDAEPDFDQAVTETITIVTIDGNTGLPVQYDQIMALEDGAQRAFYRTRIEIQIGATPPDNIITLIEERK